MSIDLKAPELRELKPRIMVAGIGGAGGNAVNNMITSGLAGVDFIVANTDAQALTASRAERIIQMGLQVTEGLGAGSQPEVGRAAAEEAMEEIRDHLSGAHMCFVTAGMGGGTGTGAAPVVAGVARDMGILTVGVVTKPFQFEGQRRMRLAESGITELQDCVDTLIVIPNQNLFRVANEKTTFADAFGMADQVLYSGVACITDLMVKEGLINLDFADVRAVMREMGKAMMGTGEASGENRAIAAAEAAIANPLLDETSMRGARGLLISITGGNDLTLYEVDEAASRIRQEVDEEANIILGATFDDTLDGQIRVSVVATGIDNTGIIANEPPVQARIAEIAAQRKAIIDANPQLQRQPQPAIAQTGTQGSPQSVDQSSAEKQPAVAAAQPQAVVAPARIENAADRAEMGRIAHHESQVLPSHMASSENVAHPSHAHLAAQAAPAPISEPRIEQPAPQNIQPIQPARMPKIEDLPVPVQQQLRAQHNQDGSNDANGAETKRRSLLERLASFGITREAETAAAAEPMRQAAAPRQAPPVQANVQRPSQATPRKAAASAPPPVNAVPHRQPQAGQHPQAQQYAPEQHHVQQPQPQQNPGYGAAQPQPAPAHAPGAAHAAYGKRPHHAQPAGAPARAPQQAQLDLHGRPQPAPRAIDDEQLEIPAFLRRQTA